MPSSPWRYACHRGVRAFCAARPIGTAAAHRCRGKLVAPNSPNLLRCRTIQMTSATSITAMNLPQDVTGMLEALLPGIRNVLGDNLVGIYLRGSLALGDFIPATSDIDVLVVTMRPVGDAEFGALADLHARLAASPHPYARRLEIAYVD